MPWDFGNSLLTYLLVPTNEGDVRLQQEVEHVTISETISLTMPLIADPKLLTYKHWILDESDCIQS